MAPWWVEFLSWLGAFLFVIVGRKDNRETPNPFERMYVPMNEPTHRER